MQVCQRHILEHYPCVDVDGDQRVGTDTAHRRQNGSKIGEHVIVELDGINRTAACRKVGDRVLTKTRTEDKHIVSRATRQAIVARIGDAALSAYKRIYI